MLIWVEGTIAGEGWWQRACASPNCRLCSQQQPTWPFRFRQEKNWPLGYLPTKSACYMNISVFYFPSQGEARKWEFSPDCASGHQGRGLGKWVPQIFLPASIQLVLPFYTTPCGNLLTGLWRFHKRNLFLYCCRVNDSLGKRGSKSSYSAMLLISCHVCVCVCILHFLFFFQFLRYNWCTTLCKFKVYSIMLCIHCEVIFKHNFSKYIYIYTHTHTHTIKEIGKKAFVLWWEFLEFTVLTTSISNR